MHTSYLVLKFTAYSRVALRKNALKQIRPKWLFGAWAFLVGVATLAWLIGLAWAAFWLVERAIS